MPELNMRPLPPNSSPASDDPESESRPKREELQRLRRQRDQLYEEARDNPDSDAEEMVRALLLSGILSTRTESEEEELVRRSLGEERRQQLRGGRQAAEQIGAEALAGAAGAKRVERRLLETEARLKEVAHVAAEAAARLAMDPAAVYRRIAEIIGLQSPAVQAREHQGGEEPGEPKK
jgi:hypothetical protein